MKDGWTLLGQQYLTNPRDLVPQEMWGIVRTWALCRGEFGMMHLPDAGGINDQAAWLLDAFAVLGQVDAELREEAKEVNEGRR